MNQQIKTGILTLLLLSFGFYFGVTQTQGQAQQGPSTTGGDALWHLPKFGESGWFLHAHNGLVRACNMDKASVVGERAAPRCSNWE
jgi:hypothetical protein